MEERYEEVKQRWEERFESSYGRGRGLVDGLVTPSSTSSTASPASSVTPAQPSTFTVPKLLRPFFLHRRELLGELCRAHRGLGPAVRSKVSRARGEAAKGWGDSIMVFSKGAPL